MSTTILGLIWSEGTIKTSPHRLATLSTYSIPQTMATQFFPILTFIDVVNRESPNTQTKIVSGVNKTAAQSLL